MSRNRRASALCTNRNIALPAAVMGVVGALSAFVCMTFLPGLGVCAVAAETSAATLSACLSMRLLPHTPHAIAPESRRTTTIPCLPPGKRFTNAAVLEQDGFCSAIGAFAWSGGPVRQPALRMHSLFPSTFSLTPLFALNLRELEDLSPSPSFYPCKASRSFTTNEHLHAQMARRALSQPQHFIRFIPLGGASCSGRRLGRSHPKNPHALMTSAGRARLAPGCGKCITPALPPVLTSDAL